MMPVKRILPAVAAVLLFILPRADGGQPAYQVQAVVGDVKIIAGGAAKPAAEGRSLGAGDTVVTGKNSMVDILWGDRGLVRVNEKTRITVASLSKKNDAPDLDMNAGSIMVMLSNLVRGERFQVKTPTQVASVRGTSFQVDADEDRSRVDVLTGTIMVHPVQDGAMFRGIAESVAEGHSVTLDRSMVRDVIAGRNRIAVSLLQKSDLDRLTGRFSAMRESRGFTRLNSRIRNEINNRMERRRDRSREGGDRDKPRREKIKQERGKRQQKPGR